ncbi:MAG TPA: Ig-like domain-containing protein [Thermoanaerobaculia bacterium]|jgi:hypothetical protein|nr:Ig-like domain-containing protein [Thermoanaerobaculia bacterium]
MAQLGPPVVPGFPNVPQVAGTLLSGLNAPQQGRTAIVAYHDGILFTVPELPDSQPGSDFQVRSWNISDPRHPVELAQHGVSPMPINAHGYIHSGPYVVLGPNFPPQAPWSWRADAPGQLTRTTFPGFLGISDRGHLFQPWFVGDTWRIYREVTGTAWISKDNVELGRWDHLGLTGVIGHPFLLGDLVIFASEESRTGIATYDVSNPAHPVLLDVLTTGGPGGYWPELWSGDGKLYVVFPYRDSGNGMRVVDATDPSHLRLIADVPLPGASAMYAQFQDEYAFIGDHKIDMRTFRSVLDLHGATVRRTNDGGTGVDTSQFALPLGNLLVTGGSGPNQGMAIWAHQSEPDTRGPAVTYHIPQSGRTNYPVGAPISLLIHETLESTTIVNGQTFIVRPVGGAALPGRLVFSFDDVLTFTPDAPLLPNTSYEVVVPAGGIKDVAGNGIVGYSYTFSTGATVGGNQAPAIAAFDAAEYPAAPGATVTLSASGSDPEGQALEYRFDFGDGSPRTEWGSGTSAAHAYAAAGHYRATVQARDAAGAIASRAVVVTVVAAPTGPQPTASGQLLCDGARGRVWTVHPDQGTVAALDATSLDVLFEVPVCAAPRSLARTAAGEVWVACSGDDRLRVLDAASGAPLAEVATGYGSAPMGVAASPNGNVVYAAFDGSGELRRYDAASRAQTGAVTLGRGAHAVAVVPDGSRVLVTRFLSPHDFAEVWDVAASSFTLTRTLRIDKLGGEANVDTQATGRGTLNYLASIVVAPDGRSAWVAGTKPNVERGLLIGPDLDSDNTVRAALVQLDLATNRVAHTLDLDNSDSPSALALSPLGDYVFATLQGNDEVMVLDALATPSSAGLGGLVTRLGTGAAPQGACADAVTQRVFVEDFLGRSVTALATGELFAHGDIQVGHTTVDTASSEVLTAAQLAGKRTFYHAGDRRMSAEGYMSCATCHVDGGHDGRVWDFTGRGEGLRRTPMLRGRAGTGAGNVHWSANFDEIQDFESDIRNHFGGSGFMDDDDFAATAAPLGPPKAGLSPELDALAAYVASLDAASLPRSAHRAADGSLSAQAAQGRLHFVALGCASCHSGPLLTDSTLGAPTLHDVGTLRTTSGSRLGGPLPGIDTPSLLGVFAAGPYFHDGSAPTLDDVFTVAGGRVVAGESGTPGPDAQLVDTFTDINNDDTVRGRAYVRLSRAGARLSFGGVDGGPGGVGALEVRYSDAGVTALDVVVNGVTRSLSLPAADNDPSWRLTNWRTVRLEGIAWNAGAANTVELVTPSGFPSLGVDEIVVSTAADLAAAAPHRAALALSAGERAELVAYLSSLDAHDVDGGALMPLLVDGFEAGNTAAWAAATP